MVGGGEGGWRVTYTFALNDPSTCTSAIFVVPKNCNVGLPRMLSSASANGFSSRSNLDFPLGVDVTLGFPRSPGADGTESRARVKLRPSRTMYESGSSSAPRYSRRWLVMVDVDAFVTSVDIIETHKWSKVNMEGARASVCLTPGGSTVSADCRDCGRTASRGACAFTKCSMRSHDCVALFGFTGVSNKAMTETPWNQTDRVAPLTGSYPSVSGWRTRRTFAVFLWISIPRASVPNVCQGSNVGEAPKSKSQRQNSEECHALANENSSRAFYYLHFKRFHIERTRHLFNGKILHRPQ